jgi:DNA polymerase III subunit delta'
VGCVVFSTKGRVISFEAIFGQDTAIQWLKTAYQADRLPHGLIFAGPVGVGKGTTARALAALFLCENPKDTTPCGKCGSCRVFEPGNHPDYHIISKELIRYHDRTGKSKGIDLSIHVIRPELIEPAGRKAVMGRGKVFVVEQAELMNPQAQNAMLKTLEEPAGRTLIILLTDQPGAMLPTVRSRCQLLRFAALTETAVCEQLHKRGIETKLTAEAARLSRGSLGIALKWIEDGVVEPARELAEQVDGALEGRPPTDLPGWLKKAAEGYAEKQLARDELASKDQAMREGMSLYLLIATERARKRLKEQQDPAELERACAAIDAIARAEMYLDCNVNTAIALQQLSMALERR